jgi:hypothetical protein
VLVSNSPHRIHSFFVVSNVRSDISRSKLKHVAGVCADSCRHDVTLYGAPKAATHSHAVTNFFIRFPFEVNCCLMWLWLLWLISVVFALSSVSTFQPGWRNQGPICITETSLWGNQHASCDGEQIPFSDGNLCPKLVFSMVIGKLIFEGATI